MFSQTQGFIFDVYGEPIENVRVYLVDQDIVTFTNQDGIFNISSTIPINSACEFYKIGYSTKVYKFLGEKVNIGQKY